ncbi:TRAP transporter substrate-binding protein DctP [Aquibium sp. LZ166]|uniref:TRAP transporter substrate-binding protein DctP n=1 Tax=Aquibium pacificus TaxID=3153579 RepID=A0ABV3SIR1_9HYPH
MKHHAWTIAIAALLAAPGVGVSEELKVAHISAESSPISGADRHFAKEVERLTGGDLTMRFFWSGSLGSGNEIIHLISSGAIPAGVTAPVYYPSELPIDGVTNALPFTFPSAGAAMDAKREIAKTDAALEEYKRAGVYPILHHGLANLHLVCSKKAETLDELKGLKARSNGFYWPPAFEAIGITPISVPFNEMYESLQRNVIDCVFSTWAGAMAGRLGEVAKYWIDIDMGALSGPSFYVPYAMYKEGGWSPERIKAIDEAAEIAFDQEKEDIEQAEKDSVAKALEQGVELVQFKDSDKVRNAIPDMVDLWVEKETAGNVSQEAAKQAAEVINNIETSN